MDHILQVIKPKKRDKFLRCGESDDMPHCFFFQQQHFKVSDKFNKCKNPV